jgi:hypothetical protein
MSGYSGQRFVFLAALVLCVVSLVVTVSVALWHSLEQARLESEVRQQAAQQARHAAQQIDQQVTHLGRVTHAMADDLSAGQLTGDEIAVRLRSIIEENPDLFGAGVAYRPYRFDPSARLFAPYYRLDPGLGRHELVQIEDVYDYTLPDGTDGVRTHWYHDSLHQGAIWSEPLFGTASDDYIASYIVPFYEVGSGGQEVAGVALTTYGLDRVRSLLASLELGRTGYAFLLSAQGLYVAHPDEAYVLEQRTIVDVADQRHDPTLREIGRWALRGESGIFDHNNTITRQSSWIIIEPIPSTGWSLGAVFIKDEIPFSDTATHRRLIWIAVSAGFFLFFLSIILFRAYRGEHRQVWAVAVVFSVLNVGMITYTWSLAVSNLLDQSDASTSVFDTAGVSQFLAPYEERVRRYYRTEPVHIPTGVFIQSVEFSTANDIRVSGYVWQRYPEDVPDWVSRGFVLPEAIETPEISEAYRSDNGEVVGWTFRATLRQPFNFSRFPFDREDVWLRLWHQDFDREVVLVPDLTSYSEINPTSKPGLELQDFVLEGWKVNSSYFSYRLNTYNTNFGMDRLMVHDGIPELYFNINLSRNFTNPFVSNLLPLVVVVFLLFAVLMIASRENGKTELFGFSTSNVLTFCAALFFVVILGHIDLRGSLNSSEVIYLEYFFFVMYLAILAVSVNSILFVSYADVALIQYRDNFIPKLLYWPVITGILLAITLWVFY